MYYTADLITLYTIKRTPSSPARVHGNIFCIEVHRVVAAECYSALGVMMICVHNMRRSRPF